MGLRQWNVLGFELFNLGKVASVENKFKLF